MKKNGIICALLCAMSLCMTGCQKTDNFKEMEESKDGLLPIYESKDEELSGENSALKTLEDVYILGYKAEEWEAAGVEEASGILCRQEDIIIADRAYDCLIAADYTGDILKKVGQTGSGKCEFLNPAAIAEYDNELYILDSGNQRVQVLDHDLNYVREIELKDTRTEDPDYVPGMLAVNASGVYVSGYSLRNPVVDRYIRNEVEEIGENFLGTICNYEEQLYLINSMVRAYDEKSDAFHAVSSGPEWLFTIEGTELLKKSSLPNGLFITDFIADEKGIVCISASGYSVFRLDWDGEYKETIAKIDGIQDEEYPKISVNAQEEYYIAMPKAGKIFRCYKNAE